MRHSLLLITLLLSLASCSAPGGDQAAPQAQPAAPPLQPATQPGLGAITWHHVGLHHNDEITLRPDGSYTLVERGTYHRDEGSPAPTAASYTETDESAGRWRPVMGNVLLLARNGAGQAAARNRLLRVFGRGDSYGFDTVASRRAGLDSRDDPAAWLALPDGQFAYLRDLARYSDEQDISALLGVKPFASSTAIPADLTASVRTQLPTGWSTTTIGNALVVARDAPIHDVGGVNMPGRQADDGEVDLFNDTVDYRYALILRLGELLTPEQVRRLTAENEALDRRLEEMREGLRDISHKFDSYLPGTDEQKRRVAAYEQAKGGRKPVPQYYTARNAVYVAESVGRGDSIVNGKEEVTDVRQKILGVLQLYPGIK